MKVINGKIVKSNSSAARELVSFYWGYNASQPGDGFEFCTEHLILSGYSRKQALQVGKIIKDTVDIQLTGIRGQDSMVLEGATVEQFLDQEQQRLDWVVSEMKDCGYRPRVERMMELAVIACCAISSLVQAGRIQQDNHNGDCFMYSK